MPRRLICPAPGCDEKIRWQDGEPRGPQYVDVPEGHDGPYYCSFECAAYAGVRFPVPPPLSKEHMAAVIDRITNRKAY